MSWKNVKKTKCIRGVNVCGIFNIKHVIPGLWLYSFHIIRVSILSGHTGLVNHTEGAKSLICIPATCMLHLYVEMPGVAHSLRQTSL